MRYTNSQVTPSVLRLRVFLSSPGDVTDERKMALEVIDRLQNERAHRDRLWLEVVAWDKPGAGTAMRAHFEPQEALNRELPRPSACDIVIVIFGYRMGTPLSEKYLKPNGERYWSGTEYEYLDAMNAAGRQNGDGGPEVLVYRKQGAPDVNAADPQRKEKLEQWDRVEAFFAEFHHSDGSAQRGFNPYPRPTEFKERLDEHLRDIVDSLLQKHGFANQSPGLADEPDWAESPYPGLRAFRTGETSIFFGRGAETDDLVEILSNPRNRVVFVVGASGSGKSSLMMAGVLPRLRSDGVHGIRNWIDVQFTPGQVGDNALMALASELAPKLKNRNWRPWELAAELAKRPEQLGELTRLILSGQPDWGELLLFIDQFEELFTVVSADHRDPFVRLLGEAAQTTRLRIVATLRSDFYDHCLKKGGVLAKLLIAGQYTLGPPGIHALHEMVVSPAKRARLNFEDGLVNKILHDTVEEPGALALLAFALSELFEKRNAPTRTLTHVAYDGSGGVQGAISKRAEEIFEALDAPAQGRCEGVFRELVKVDERGVATRQRTALTSFAGDTVALQLIDAFAQNRLLVADRSENSEPVVEVAHEALLQNWPRLLAWIESTRDDRRLLAQMRVAAQQWNDRGRKRAYLWTLERATELMRMLANLNPRLTEIEQAFCRPEAEHLQDELNERETTHDRRAQIGDRLAELGDPRPGVGLRPDGLPDLAWCYVPVDTSVATPQERLYFPTSTSKALAEVNIVGIGSVRVESFYIARYPITYAQYDAFLRAKDGFRNPQWWNGMAVSDSQRANPGIQTRKISNHPAENVSWYDATAFCRWLSVRIGYQVRLMNEAEWQFAAIGKNNSQAYPWGQKWRPEYANTSASNLNRVIAVGMYPCGAAMCGAQDMAGNVCEWTLSTGGEEHRRVIRGGSWYLSAAEARSTGRATSFAYQRLNHYGFRIACSHYL